jgi:hypothetical protein
MTIENVIQNFYNKLSFMREETLLKIKQRIVAELAIRNRQSVQGMPPPTEREMNVMLLDSQFSAIKLYRDRVDAGECPKYSLYQIKKVFDAKKEELKENMLREGDGMWSKPDRYGDEET